jgi:hypothetical protein
VLTSYMSTPNNNMKTKQKEGRWVLFCLLFAKNTPYAIAFGPPTAGAPRPPPAQALALALPCPPAAAAAAAAAAALPGYLAVSILYTQAGPGAAIPTCAACAASGGLRLFQHQRCLMLW